MTLAPRAAETWAPAGPRTENMQAHLSSRQLPQMSALEMRPCRGSAWGFWGSLCCRGVTAEGFLPSVFLSELPFSN